MLLLESCSVSVTPPFLLSYILTLRSTVSGSKDQENYEALYTVGPILHKTKPRVATLEQTTGLITNKVHRRNFRLLINDVHKAGYNVRWKIEDFSNFGLPHKRKRLLLIAAR